MKATIGIRTACTLAAALGLALCGMAQGPGPGFGPGFGRHTPPMERAMGPMGGHGRWWNNPAVVERLKLTDDQRKTMDAILLDHRERLIDLRATVDKAELAMEPLVQADQPNEGAILAQIDKVAQARADLEKANARFLLGLRAKLTPEQWKTLREMRTERRDQRMWRARAPRDGHGRGNGPKQGPGNCNGNGPCAGGAAPATPPPSGL